MITDCIHGEVNEDYFNAAVTEVCGYINIEKGVY
jgi:hypothetical protein